jgi:hypothetical protein
MLGVVRYFLLTGDNNTLQDNDHNKQDLMHYMFWCISIWQFLFLIFFVVLGIHLRAFNILGKSSSTCPHPSHTVLFCFWDGVSVALLRLVWNLTSFCFCLPGCWDYKHVPRSLFYSSGAMLPHLLLDNFIIISLIKKAITFLLPTLSNLRFRSGNLLLLHSYRSFIHM